MPVTDPFQELAYFHRRMNRLLEESLGRGRSAAAGRSGWTPRVNIYDLPEEIVILVELPGIEAHEEVEVEVRDGSLIVSGFRSATAPEEDAQPLLTEGSFGPFRRVIDLPAEADSEGIRASMNAGVLTVRVPKRRGRGPFQVEIVEFG